MSPKFSVGQKDNLQVYCEIFTSHPRGFISITGHCESAVLRIRYSQQRNNQKSISSFKQHIVSQHVEIHAGPRGGTTHRNQRRRSVKVFQNDVVS